MKKIIILPSFASSHLLKCSIPNWIDVIEPDIIIINEGLFPEGPENKGHIDDEFRKKWCLKNSNSGFDFNETINFVIELIKEKGAGNNKIPYIEVREIRYTDLDVNNCFLKAISDPLNSLVSIGDIVMPLEPDVLFHQDDKDKIQEHLSRLTAGNGIQCVWKDFLETQFYTEMINEVSPKWRRFAYCFDTMQNYRSAMDAFMTQNYTHLKKVHDFFGFHYPWFCPEPWKQLRYELIYRKDPKYWQDFEEGLQNIRNESNYIGKHWTYVPKDKILIRPSRQDEARWATFMNVSHPDAIQNHENYCK